MSRVISVIIVFIMSLLFVPRAHAIIILPAVILIPIAKIIALIIGGFSIPMFGVGTLWSKLFKKSLLKTIFIIVLILLLLAGVLTIILKIYNPERPLF